MAGPPFDALSIPLGNMGYEMAFQCDLLAFDCSLGTISIRWGDQHLRFVFGTTDKFCSRSHTGLHLLSSIGASHMGYFRKRGIKIIDFNSDPRLQKSEFALHC